MSDFTSSALIGHLIASNLLAALVGKGVISAQDAAEMIDDALLKLETYQSSFPENEAAFSEARSFLDGLLQDYGKIGPEPIL
jgi:polyhydroxyalkanoate synthesis regulator phasin